MAQDKGKQVRIKATPLQAAQVRLRQQIKDIKSRTSAAAAITDKPPSPVELMAYMIANDICMMMAMADLCEILEPLPPIPDELKVH